MVYRATPNGTSGYSPYYLLHGREIILPNSQHLKAKLMQEVRETEPAPRLENLKSSLRSAYKLVRENSRISHEINKSHYDRTAKERIFEPGDSVYLFSPGRKPGQGSKFWTPWIGPYVVAVRLSKLNYRIKSTQGKESVVLVNRMKRAYKQGTLRVKGKGRSYRKHRARGQELEE